MSPTHSPRFTLKSPNRPSAPRRGRAAALIAPVDLGLRAGHHLEASVQPAQRIVTTRLEFGRDPRPGLGQEHLHPLIRAGKAMLGDQPS